MLLITADYLAGFIADNLSRETILIFIDLFTRENPLVS